MFRTLVHLAADAPAAPDYGWLIATAGRALLALQLGVTILLALRVAADSSQGALGDSNIRAQIKDTIGERGKFFVVLWSVIFIVGIGLWIVGKSDIVWR